MIANSIPLLLLQTTAKVGKFMPVAKFPFISMLLLDIDIDDI